MTFWIWDEDHFPSGLAGGRVVWSDPGLISRGLGFTVARVEGDGPFEVDFSPGMLLRAFVVEKQPDNTFGEPLDVTRFCGTRRQRWTSRHMLHRARIKQEPYFFVDIRIIGWHPARSQVILWKCAGRYNGLNQGPACQKAGSLWGEKEVRYVS